jgi:hypothetical protein
MQSSYKEVFGSIEQQRMESSFEPPASRDMSLGVEELNWVEFWRWQSKVIENNGKKGIRPCKVDFVCDLKLQ